MSKLTSRRPRTYTQCCLKPSEITPPTIGFWHFLRTPISRVSKQKLIRTLNTNNFSPQPSMASHPTSADSMAPWDPSSPFFTTYELPTGLSCMAQAWWFPYDSGKRFSTSCIPPIKLKAKTALYAGPDRWSTGHPSQTIFAMWSVAARRAQNAFPPMCTPLSPSWSNRRRPARSSVLPPTSSSWRATTFWCTPTAALAGPQSAPVAAQSHRPRSSAC